jgi:hypothetical protein
LFKKKIETMCVTALGWKNVAPVLAGPGEIQKAARQAYFEATSVISRQSAALASEP